MNAAFGQWVESQGLTISTRKTQMGHLTRLEQAYGDLDTAYDEDQFRKLREALVYSSSDRDAGRPNPSKVTYKGTDLYHHLVSLRTALNYYSKFRVGENESSDWPELEEMKVLFAERCPDFISFEQMAGSYYMGERRYKDELIVKAQEALQRILPSENELLGQRILEIIKAPPANFVNWRTSQQFKEPEDLARISAIIGRLVRASGDIPAAIEQAADEAHAVMRPNAQQEIFGGIRSLVTTALAVAKPDEAISVKTTYMTRAARDLVGESIFHTAKINAPEYRAFLALSERVREHMRRWGWKPRDLWDIQGFFWVVTQDHWNAMKVSSADGSDIEDEVVEDKILAESAGYALNTILFGPPGTGKTYKTAEMAVSICNGVVPETRGKIMEEYKKLIETNRVWFTTFHQSIGYEEFVEGLRPVVASDGGMAVGSGFQLEAKNGIFREVCAQAEAATKQAALSLDFSFVGRTFYKMSLGQTGIEDDIYQAALNGDYIVLGWGGEVDWSDSKYKDYTAILEKWEGLGKKLTGNSGDVIQVARFRSMNPGDIVIIPEGNTRFRAIGEVDGHYTFTPGTLGGNHRRKVKWLLKLGESLPLETIYNGTFAQAACYLLAQENIKLPALQELIRPTVRNGTTAAAPYVLIIDEINRANISKVLGEMITLLEPDKRLGAENEITLTLPYSKARFGVPRNLHLIGTMNTADRSIAPIDTALRRRFDFVPMMPDYAVLETAIVEGISLEGLLRGINDRIEWLFDRDHQLGHALFISVESKSELDRVMRKRVVPLLAEYFFDDLSKVRSVLNDSVGHFIREEKLNSPLMEADKEPKLRYLLMDGPVPIEAYEAAIAQAHG